MGTEGLGKGQTAFSFPMTPACARPRGGIRLWGGVGGGRGPKSLCPSNPVTRTHPSSPFIQPLYCARTRSDGNPLKPPGYGGGAYGGGAYGGAYVRGKCGRPHSTPGVIRRRHAPVRAHPPGHVEKKKKAPCGRGTFDSGRAGAKSLCPRSPVARTGYHPSQPPAHAVV